MREPPHHSLVFRLPDLAEAAVAAIPVLAERGRNEILHEIWLDTADRDLRAAGLIATIAQVGRGRVLRTRRWPGDDVETDWPDKAIETDRVGVADLPASAAQSLDGVKVDTGLLPVFRVEGERRVRRVARPGAVLRLTREFGAYIASGARADARELKIEIVSGRPSALFAFAREIAGQGPLRPEFGGRAEQGFRLDDGAWGEPVGKIAAPIDSDMTAAEAFDAIAFACLRQFSLNAPAFTPAHQVEAVHQTRVAIRRLRSALALFAPMLRDEILPRIRAELKWLFAGLGEARDLDVWLEQIADSGILAPAEALARLESERAEAHARVAEALTSPRLDKLLLDIAEWIAIGPWRRSRDPRQTRDRGRGVADFAKRRLARRHDMLVRLAEAFDDLDVESLHQLRIEAKNLRYMSEFLAPLAGERKARHRYEGNVRALAALQDSLGLVHDMDAREANGGLAPDLVALMPAPSLDRAHLMRDARREAGELLRTKPFWEAI